MTRRNVANPLAPRSRDASMYEWGIRSTAPNTGRIMNGSHTYVKTSQTAKFVYARCTSGRPSLPSVQLRTPSWFRISRQMRSEEHTSELQSRRDLVCRLLLEKKKI